MKSINPDGRLKEPVGICIGIRKNEVEEIYVYEYEARTVFVLNRDFKLIKKIGVNLEASYYLTIDCDNLYCLHGGSVTVWNVNYANLIKKLEIEHPLDLKISENKIYIVSEADYDSDRRNRKLIKVKKGNYINVLNKSNHEIINILQFDDWFDPHSLHVSSKGDVYTTAYELDTNNGIYSKNRFLFIINSTNYQIKQKIELNDVDSFGDGLHLINQLILCHVNGTKNLLRIIEFE